MLNGYKIIDADSHVVEPWQLWEKYLEPRFQEYAPSAKMQIKGKPIAQMISEEVRQEANQKMQQAHPHAYFKGYDAESHLQGMMMMGSDIAFVYPTYGLWLFAIDSFSSEVMGGFTRAYNSWLHQEFCSFNPDILKGVGAMNLHDPEEMVKEVHRIASWGWKAVFLRPNPVKGRILSDRIYEPFWSACEELDVAVGIHEGTHSLLPTTGDDRFTSRFALHACSHPMENMMALLALIEGGVLERHPKLRVAFLESGCGWLPYWLWRLDEEYEQLHWEVKENVKMKPSEYFRRQCYISIEPSEKYLPQLIDYLGADNLIVGSDYPHMDHEPDILKKVVEMEKTLSPEIIQKIIWSNPSKFYGLD